MWLVELSIASGASLASFRPCSARTTARPRDPEPRVAGDELLDRLLARVTMPAAIHAQPIRPRRPLVTGRAAHQTQRLFPVGPIVAQQRPALELLDRLRLGPRWGLRDGALQRPRRRRRSLGVGCIVGRASPQPSAGRFFPALALGRRRRADRDSIVRTTSATELSAMPGPVKCADRTGGSATDAVVGVRAHHSGRPATTRAKDHDRLARGKA
jgi:hypothetical protein